MSTSSRFLPVYVFELPVRIWHWLMALCMVVLVITGYLIGTPVPSLGGEASEHFFFGYIRYLHFGAAYLFAITFVWRVTGDFRGNRYSREIFLVPLKMFDGEWWGGLIEQVKYYLFLTPHARTYEGHNPLAMAGMFFMYVLGTIFMICTGFAMYGEAQGMESWTFRLFSSWVMPLLGYSQNVHTLHHLGMWYLILFTIVHLYMVVREDIYSDETVISTMVSGWRVSKK